MRYILMFLGIAALAGFDLWILRQAKDVSPLPVPAAPWGGMRIGIGSHAQSKPPVAGIVQSGDPSSTNTGEPSISRTNLPPATSNASARASVTRQRDQIAGEYIFGFHDRADRDAFERAARTLGWEVTGRLDFANAVRARRGERASSLEDLLSASPTPVEQSPNFYVRVPPKPPADKADLAARPGFERGVLEWLGVPPDNREWGRGVVVGILDTAVGRHPSLENSIVDRLGEGGEGGSGSAFLHGTAVAALIAASGGGLRGVAPSATVLSLPVLDDSGQGDVFSLAEGILRAVQAGARVLNMSVGTYGDSWLLRRAVGYAVQNGAVLVAAAGNDGEERLVYPAAYPGVVAVAATDAAGRRLSFSNKGENLALAAPGWRVRTAGPADELVEMSGTSASAALTSGAIAALLSRNLDLAPADAVRILEQYSDDTGRMGRDDEIGSGMLNIGRAMNRDLAGVYDAVVCYPYLWPRRSPEDDVVVTLYVQNRGTEIIQHLLLKVGIGAREESLDYYNVAVGASVGRDFRIAAVEASQPEGVSIIVEAVVDGQTDVQPSDNILRTAVRLRSEYGKR